MVTVVTTVLFTDIVGSTELSSSLGEEAAHRLRQSHFSLLSAAITAANGRQVKNLGDGVMAVFPSASAAIDAAVEIQRSVDRDNRHSHIDAPVRVGLSTGEATEDGGDYFGQPVIEAARLCALARGGQILVTDLAVALARGNAHEVDRLGARELKGLPHPVDVAEIRWEPIGGPAIPFPPLLSDPNVAPFVGRAVEHEQAIQSLKAAANGERRAVLFGGEPGIGKTRLAAEVAALAHEDGAIVLYGRSDEELGLPYQSWAEALGHLVAHAPAELLTAHVAEHGGELVRLVPAMERLVPNLPSPRSTDPETERYMLWNAVGGLLRTASQDATVVLFLDDLHWADRPTLALLRHLMTSEDLHRLLVLGTYRESELSGNEPLTGTLAALRRVEGVARIRLDGLDDAEVLAYMEGIAGHRLNDDGVELAHAVQRETAGNPFFARELLRHLAETGAIRRDDDGHWAATTELTAAVLPASVRDVVEQRVLRLGERASQLLGVAAVVGKAFDLRLVAAIGDVDDDDALDIAEAAASAFLLNEVPNVVDRFEFTHALVQHTLYTQLSAARRRRLHRRAAEILEAGLVGDPADRVGELARHWAAAVEPVDSDKAIYYAAKAGERALATLAPDEAMRWYTQALELADQAVPDGARRARLLVGLGDSQRQSGDPAYRTTLLSAADEATRAGASDLLVAAALANSRGVQSAFGEVDTERMDVLEGALAAISEADSAERARLLAVRAMEGTYIDDIADRIDLADRAVSMARRLEDHATLGYVLQSTQHPVWVPETLERRLADTAEAVALAEASDDPVALFWATYERHIAVGESGDYADVDRCLARMTALTNEVRQPVLAWVTAWCRSWRTLFAGDPDEADRIALEGLQAASDSGQPDAMLIYGSQLLATRWYQGRIAELVDLAGSSAESNPGIAAFRAVHAYALVEAGRRDDAQRMLSEQVAEGFATRRDLVWSTTMALWTEVAWELADREAAALLVPHMAPFAGHLAFTGNVNLGLVALPLGLAAATARDFDAADGYFAHALAEHERLNAPFHLARTQLGWAKMLNERAQPGDAARARTLAETAHGLAVQYGCAGIQQRAAALLDSV